ncbi:zinc finger CCCH domain-containing protein 44-like [Impatiens glandulifera]|uniref:zinc finger CCCH domain-containing protein 44-like n=1 Tax=Impatiens glandulifera TaxID=253017 RepID=UPI001FB0C510|nr:zinc finger CCCH domain-containing protein 44-like [Impatiens glandulifera]XP_047310148.1 zinc finger CCCH domain-containing protein 44-like [Impatiens glandulifera]
MEALEFSSSASCIPSSGDQDSSLNHSGVHRPDLIPKLEDGLNIGVLANGGEEGSGLIPVTAEEQAFEGSNGKKKRGRPPSGQPKMPQIRKVKDEEDVCFICFDGGNLVLCDRRACPKAYHPTCIKRNESFFRAKSKWNCGWHTCSSCQKKASHYMCLTCTYSLCKTCSKGADYVCIRENKGFCSLCMKTIMLIENKDQREMVQVDFDDKTSWEYLFKMYWLYTKDKLSLTLDELTKAKTPRKAAGNTAFKGKDLVTVSGNKNCRRPTLDAHYKCNDLDVNSTVINQQIKISHNIDSPAINTPSTDGGALVTGSAKWASKELLAFVAHIKNGETSVLSLHDVQILLQGYVQRNNLHDPIHKSQIICDTRLVKLFGKPRVGHFEMLKLLEFHFPLKDESLESVSLFNMYPTAVSEPERNGNSDYYFLTSGDKKRKNCLRGEGGSSTDLSEYAAIDVHNISLIYLRRRLLENLVHDIDKFHEKVVGSIVRTRFFNGDQKQDMYELVQVIGTCKISVPYKLGEKTVDVVLEVLNMDKKETVSIDAISNEEFSAEECGRLRESIKCGLVKHLTVGLIQEKAKALREVIVKYWLEIEVLRLNHLRDSANENGQENKLRDYVEKLEVLQSPEERKRILQEVPEVHVDSNLNPHNNSAEDAGELTENKKAKHLKTQDPVFNMNGRVAIPSRKADGGIHDACNKTFEDNISENNGKSTADDFNKVTPTSVSSQGLDKCSQDGENDVCGSSISERAVKVDSYCSAVGGCNSPAVISSGSFSGVVSENSVAGSSPLSHTSETENIWRYRDTIGEVQGPFCLTLLRKWITTGLLPSDMRVWSIYNEEVDSLLLSDVLKGQLSQKLSSRQSSLSLPSPEIQGGSISENGSTSTLTSTGLHSCKQSTISQNFSNTNKLVHGDEIFSRSSNLATSSFKCVDINKTNSPGWDSLKVNDNYSQQPQVLCSDSTPPMPESLKSGPDYRSWNSSTNQTTPETSYGNQSSNLGLPSEQCGVPPVLSDKWDLNSSLGSEAKSSPVSPMDNCKNDIPLKPCPILNDNVQGLEGKTAREGQSEALNFLVDELRIQNQSSKDEEVQGFQNKHSLSSSWSCNSNLVVGGATFTCPEPPMDHASAATLTCNNNQLVSDSMMPVIESDPSNWLEMFTEPIESVSDLLDQVEAMQSQGGLSLPESDMNCVDYLFEDSENDYFCPIGAGLRPAPDSGIHFEPIRAGGQSSSSVVEMKFNNNMPVKWQNEASGSNCQTRESSMITPTTTSNINWGPNEQQQGYMNPHNPMGGGGGWGWMSHANGNGNGNMNMMVREEIPSSSIMNNSRSSRPHDGFGSKNYFRSPTTTEGQRVCRFYENGQCKKGAFCEYLHP